MAKAPNLAHTQRSCFIRPARAGDYEKMAVLAGQLGYPSTAAQIEARFAPMENSSMYALFVAEDAASDLVGWISTYLFRSMAMDCFAEISGLVVDENNRSRGVGKLLLKAGEDWARAQGCSRLSVRSNVSRERAHRFYARNGFEQVKTQVCLSKKL